MVCKRLLLVSVAACALASLPAAVYANVYASGLQAVGDDGLSFILNENADTNVKVEVLADGVPVYTEDLGPKAAGTHTWSWSGAGFVTGANHTVKITASDDGYAGWTQISDEVGSNLTHFERPRGVAVQNDPGTANYGKVYVGQATNYATVSGRAMSSGVYMLNADGSDAGHATGGYDWSGAGVLAPNKMLFGPDGHLYVADNSNDFAVEFSADMSSTVQLTDASNLGTNYIGALWVEGTQAGGNRKIYAVDNHYTSPTIGVIEYNLGGNATATSGDTGTQRVGPAGLEYYAMDVERDSAGNWYVNEFRSEINQANALTKFAPDGTTILWESDITDPTRQGAYGIALDEGRGVIAYGHYYTGEVVIYDMISGLEVDSFDAGSRILDLDWDSAGNLYTCDNLLERLRIWSPGTGLNSFTTESYFTIIPEPATLVLLTLGGFLLRRRVR